MCFSNFERGKRWTEILAVLDIEWKLWKMMRYLQDHGGKEKRCIIFYHIRLMRVRRLCQCKNTWRWMGRPLLRTIQRKIQWSTEKQIWSFWVSFFISLYPMNRNHENNAMFFRNLYWTEYGHFSCSRYSIFQLWFLRAVLFYKNWRFWPSRQQRTLVSVTENQQQEWTVWWIKTW